MLPLLFYWVVSTSGFGFWTEISPISPKVSYISIETKFRLTKAFCSGQCHVPVAQHRPLFGLCFLEKTPDRLGFRMPQGFACSFWSLGSASIRNQLPEWRAQDGPQPAATSLAPAAPVPASPLSPLSASAADDLLDL